MNKDQLMQYIKEQEGDIIIKINHDGNTYNLTDIQKIEDISIGGKPYISISIEEE